MKRFLKGRTFNLLMYTFFAIALPLIALDWYFPFYNIVNQTKTIQIGFGGFIALLVVLAFTRKKIVKWVKSFDRVTWFKSIFMWLVYVFPSAFSLLIVAITYKYGQQFLYIFSCTFASHMLAGVFSIKAEKAKLEKFKRWVRK